MSGVTLRELMLDEAATLVSHDRNDDYGDPGDNFSDIAQMWSAYKGITFTAHDVAARMVLTKVARLKSSPGKDDNWVDIAGYAAVGYEVRPQ